MGEIVLISCLSTTKPGLLTSKNRWENHDRSYCNISVRHDCKNRFESNEISTFISTIYSKEELIVEIYAFFLNNHPGVINDDTLTDSAANIQGWLNKLRNNKKFIVEASARAQKALD